MTRAQLEARVAELEAELLKRDRALAALASRQAMEVVLPGAPGDGARGVAPHLPDAPGLTDRVLRALEPALRRHGTELRYPAAATLRLHDNPYRLPGEALLVPLAVGEALADVVDAAAEFSRECYAEGFQRGADLLARVAKGDLDLGQLEAGVDRARERQGQALQDRVQRPPRAHRNSRCQPDGAMP